MRIGHYSNAAALPGGTATYVLTLLKARQAHGHDVVLYLKEPPRHSQTWDCLCARCATKLSCMRTLSATGWTACTCTKTSIHCRQHGCPCVKRLVYHTKQRRPKGWRTLRHIL